MIFTQISASTAADGRLLEEERQTAKQTENDNN